MKPLLLLLFVVALHAQSPGPQECWQRTAEDFVPMTTSIRLAHAVTSVIGPSAFLYTAIRAGASQGNGSPREWGGGLEGYGRRYGSAYAQTFIQQSLAQSTELLLRQDSRYFRSGQRGFRRRLVYAVSSAFLARRDDGSRTIAYPAIGGLAGAAFISRVWQPHSTNSAGDGAVSFGVGMGVHIGLDVAREFAPRFLGAMLK